MDYYKDTSLLSNSMVGRLLEDERLFTEFMKGNHQYETTLPMVVGNIVHHNVFLEMNGGDFGEEAPKTAVVKDYDRRSKAGKEAHIAHTDAYGTDFIKESENDDAMRAVEFVMKDPYSKMYMDKLKSEYVISYEEVSTNDILGVACKGKKDITCRDINGNIKKIVDLKTTGDITKFSSSVRMYGYDRQVAFYTQLDGLDMSQNVFDFWVVDKKTGMVNIFNTYQESFVTRANSKLEYGINAFKAWKEGNLEILRIKELY